MLSTTARSCVLATLLACSTLADPIAFGNPAFAGITFGAPFSIDWFGGDATPVTIKLLTGNPAALNEVATLAVSLPANVKPVSWTPTASDSIRPGQLYTLSIEQSGLTNYSPMFGIGASTTASNQIHMAYGAPLPVGTGHYYAYRDVEAPAKRNVDNTGFVLPRSLALNTGTGLADSHAYATGTPGISGSGSGTGAVIRGAQATTSPIEPPTGEGSRLGLGVVTAMASAGCVLLLSWV
ncbi:MAG: hypothetical protein Q9212_006571 [Teloschistes hypoglaucus]